MKLELTDKETKAILARIKKQLPRAMDDAIVDLAEQIAESWMKENKELMTDSIKETMTKEVWPTILKNFTADYKRNGYLTF